MYIKRGSEKINMKKNKQISIRYILLAVVAFSVLAISPFINRPQTTSAASTSELQAQAKALQAQINANNAKVAELKKQAATLENKLAEINAQIGQINAQIQLTSVKIAELEEKLKQTQAELDRQKSLLKASMRILYKKQGASTVELLAGSDTFSDFFNEQEYLDRIKDSIQDSAKKVIELKEQIEKQKTQQQQLLEAQQGQKQQLASKQNEQQALLDATNGQAQNYAAAAEDLRRQQAAINAQLAVTGNVDYTATSSYPWAGYEPWSFDGCTVDPWGMCVRQCVSYTAWKVAQSGRNMPYWGGFGNANQWDDNARVAGIPVDYSPRAGDVAVSNAGYYGHVMYVEYVLPDGRIHVSQYNYELRGLYSEMTINPGSLVFIHF